MLSTKAKATLVKLYKDEDGGELLEYALIAGLIVIAAIGAIKVFSGAISAKFNEMGTKVTGTTVNSETPA
ncbi:MAG: Flp family type IVb pilin [Planctomycetota bacterium]